MSENKRINKANGRQNTRHKKHYDAYRMSGRREINKAKRLYKHIQRFPADHCAKACIKGLNILHLRTARRELTAAGIDLKEAA